MKLLIISLASAVVLAGCMGIPTNDDYPPGVCGWDYSTVTVEGEAMVGKDGVTVFYDDQSTVVRTAIPCDTPPENPVCTVDCEPVVCLVDCEPTCEELGTCIPPTCEELDNCVVEVVECKMPITAADIAEDKSGKERCKDVGTNYETETPNRHDNSVKEDTDTENNPKGDEDDATDGETSTPPNTNPNAAFNR